MPMWNKINRLIPFLFLALVSIFLTSCIETSEGCLDAFATNLDVEALDDCCCEYPDVNLRMSNIWNDTTSFRLLDTLIWEGDTLILHDFAIYISDYSISDTNTSDNLINRRYVNLVDGSQIADNIGLLDLSKSTINLMNIRQLGTYDRFDYGISFDQKWLQVDTLELDASHAWRDAKMNVNGQKIAWFIRYQLGTTTAPIRTHYGNQLLDSTDMKPITLTLTQGVDATFSGTLNVQRLLKDVPLEGEDAAAIYGQLIRNISDAWTTL